ncbi:stAR-related lipid transfer protein 13-like isoform X1 [Hippocampus zosterae]|uniref:stAR-related lipid transfer protein 13-like isoform X1 n=1 Tax=Hippocampus zosterae TaxID=109293 RepID=UPI00223D017F|nr:stAR-related lipid transfer protein 13-like isoform X1 [Hippocampus zosterae]
MEEDEVETECGTLLETPNSGESDSDSANEGTCLEAMTPDGQDHYLRLGQTPRRRSALRLSRIIARKQLLRRLQQELEAKEACDWLRAAGFPQYVQLYEDSQFPINISAVKRDHDFLDRDLVEPLTRRLNTLNKSASMKLDLTQLRKKGEDSDEDDPMAISKRWTFEWSSRRWSRLEDFPSDGGPQGGGHGPCSAASSESALSELSEQELAEISSLQSEDSADAMSVASLSAFFQPPPPDLSHYNSLPIKGVRQGQAGRSKAKEFLRRMEVMRTWGPSTMRKSSKRRAPMVISGPVLQGEEPLALQVLQCTPIDQLEQNLARNNGETSPGEVGNCGNDFDDDCADLSRMNVSPIRDPTPARARTASKRSSKYLEDMELPLRGKRPDAQRNQFHSHENLLIHVPKDHKPGTFPKALSIESLTPGRSSADLTVSRPSKSRNPDDIWSCRPLSKPSCPKAPRGSRVSVYDNVPGSHLYASTGDIQDLEKEDNLFPHLDDIIQHVSGLQQIVDQWSRGVLADSEDGQDGDVSQNDTDSIGTSRDRRDSGVGASLTRPRVRWPSFRTSHHLNQPSSWLHISCQSAAQLSLLHKFSLLRLTAIMEKYSMSNKHGWTWSVPKFMKRLKSPDSKEKSVFGVPLIVHVRRCGFPLPLCLQQALAHLTRHCLDQVGLFRKSGAKSRIQSLRHRCDASPDSVDYEEQSAYDVADMVKQFFRDLPEPLLSNKLGETFLHIYQYVPKEQRLQAVRAAILLMADENRQALQTLLYFLRGVAAQVDENQMTAANLAVCLAPSLFHLSLTKSDTLSPRSIQRKYGSGRPDQKDLNENLAATQGLAHMITECLHLFQIPEEMVSQSRNSYMEAELTAPPLGELGKIRQCDMEEDGEEVDEEDEEVDEGSYHAYVEKLIHNLLKETKDKSKAWICRPTGEHVELASKKVGDGNPLRRWRVSTEVEATPAEVLHRLLRERPLWQMELQQEKVVETLDKQTDVYQYCCHNMAPQPRTDFVILRSWRSDPIKGWCALVCVSVDRGDGPRTAVRGVVLESHYLLESFGMPTRTRLTHVSRVDLRGRAPEWYNKAYGHLCANEAQRIRASFLRAVEPSQ